MVTASSSPLRLTWASIALAVLIVLAAVALRMAVVVDRAAGDERFIPPFLSDSDTYYQLAVRVLERTYPYDKPYDYQPGIMYAYAALMAVVGKSVVLLRLALCVMDGLAIGAVIAAGWLLTRRLWGGWLAGGLMALYPVSVYYASVMLIEPFAALLLALWLVVVLCQMEASTRTRTVLIGLLTGALFVTRSNVAAVTLIYGLWAAAQRPGWRRWLTQMVVIAVTSILVIAPFTAWNVWIQPQKFQLLQGEGWWQLYSANNRDGDGTGGRSAAFDAQDRPNVTDQTHWRDALLRDMALNPVRFGGLLLRKAAIFWSDAEPGNNDDFYNIRALSPTLQALPAVAFPHLVALALIGLWALAWVRRDQALFFAGVIAVLFAGVLISFALSRFRYPTVIVLFPLAAYGMVSAVNSVKMLFSPLHNVGRGRGWGLRGISLLIALVILWALPRWALDSRLPPVPPKATHSALPADAIPLNVTFGEAVILHGWRYAPYTRWWPFAELGWANASDFPAYTVELFWSIKAETDIEYQFFIGIVGENDVRYGSLDRALGTVSYPPHTTNDWTPNVIYSELVSFQPTAEMPRGVSLPVRVGVYTREGTIFTQGDETTPLPITDPPTLTGVVLQTVALYDASSPSIAIPAAAQQFGDVTTGQIALYDFGISAAEAGQPAQWRMTWQPVTDVTRDVTLFIHIMDANDQLAAQWSGPPIPSLLTSNWQPHMVYNADLLVTMPEQAGEYRVYIGLIDAQTGERLLTDAPDNRPLMGTLTVR